MMLNSSARSIPLDLPLIRPLIRPLIQPLFVAEEDASIIELCFDEVEANSEIIDNDFEISTIKSC